jgi:HlyD family secretion protein
MNNLLFRKVALDRLSSPEQLDQILQLTTPQDWAVIVGVLLLVAGTGAWVWLGRITSTVSGQGVLVRTGGIVSVAATGSGQIVSVLVKPGDHIRPGQQIARIAQPSLAEQVRNVALAVEEARRDSDGAVRMRAEAARLQITALDQQRSTAEREAEQLRDDERFAAEYLRQQDQLFAEGLVTKQNVAAARQKLGGIQSEIARLKAGLPQFEAERFSAEAAPQQLRLEGQSRIADLRRRLNSLMDESERAAVVRSSSTGEVIEVKTYPGATVTAGVPIVTMQPEQGGLEGVIYLSAYEAKQVQSRMQAQVSPSTVRREEHGYLRATVLSVAQYPSTRAALMRNFENESLLSALTDHGPVTEVRLALTVNPSAPSGFRWSSGLGPPITLSSGTLCVARIVTKQERPLQTLLPFIRGQVGAY